LAVKPQKRTDYTEVGYSEAHWALLEKLRQKTIRMMTSLESSNINAIVHGSIARGDVSTKSDIDIFIPESPSSFLVETTLEKAGFHSPARYVVQATPKYAMKAHIEIDERTTVSFPLMTMRKIEREFYKFGGEMRLNKLCENLRVPGVDKRLMLIDPTEKGHLESSVIGREEQTANFIGVSVETVLDRVRALLRRDEVGRTGLFLKRELSRDESFELVLKKLAELNPAIRRRIRGNG